MFLDQAYCLLFTQWFQRKNLKTTPTTIAVEFEHPELCCFIALGLYWACDNGLVRPNHGGFPTPAQRRRDAFVFQDLHDMNDASVARQLSNIIKSVCWMEIQPSVELRSLCASCYIWRQCASICEENPRVSGSYDPTKCQKNKIF
jgi:hypothetical protein